MNSTTGLLRRPAPARRAGGIPFLRGPAPAGAGGIRSLAANWQRLALPTLLLVTAVAYLWDLSASGYANSFYAAAVQAGTKSWKAFFFGSIDSSSFITVDKPPASLWVMALSGRVFGFSSWSMLAPQALEGVAAVALLYAAIKRWFGMGAGLAAGALLAATPVAALMFRFNNPDALLVLLLVAGAYCLTRALERAGTRWVVAAGTMIGFAFLAKMMQAFLVVPAFALVYLLAAPTGLRRRIAQMLAGGAAIVVSAGWWVAIVALWPTSSRPMIDGSSDNSILNLITGYNGLGRIFGSGGPSGGGGGGGNFSGATGVLRLFNSVMGGQASWLLPAALLALGAGLIATRRSPRTDRTRAALLLWGGWLVVSGLVFSLSSGVIHTYYTVALAPAIAALVAIGGRMLWAERDTTRARLTAAAAVALSAGWSWELLDRTPSWEPWLRTLILACAVVSVIALVLSTVWRPLRSRLAVVAVVLGVMASVAGPVAYAAQTVGTAHTGSVPSAGPASAGGMGGGFGGGMPGGTHFRGAPPSGMSPGAFPGGGTRSATMPSGARGGATGNGTSGGGTTGGGMPGGQTVSAALKRALQADSGRYRWVAATSGSQSAASLELATGGEPVMAIGGFNGQGGELTLAQFESYAKAGDIHYYIASGGGGVGGGGSSSAIATWVKAHYTAVTIGGQTLYDLTQPLS
ncbi:MAG TPA: glycosyltransferase family 39 protein [Solirubrobacteraceae bacterium]|nr:glycosyltransferase family 39 protein [Solirubrobacteraceae bacterium]